MSRAGQELVERRQSNLPRHCSVESRRSTKDERQSLVQEVQVPEHHDPSLTGPRVEAAMVDAQCL